MRSYARGMDNKGFTVLKPVLINKKFHFCMVIGCQHSLADWYLLYVYSIHGKHDSDKPMWSCKDFWEFAYHTQAH